MSRVTYKLRILVAAIVVGGMMIASTAYAGDDEGGAVGSDSVGIGGCIAILCLPESNGDVDEDDDE